MPSRLSEHIHALKAAFPHTVPVLTGYGFLGFAYGVLMRTNGFGIGWTVLLSTCVYAGSMQYVGLTLLVAAFNPLHALLLTLVVNARHLFYGISMLDSYRGMGICKPLLIFWLTDETFSIVCSAEPPAGVSRRLFMLYVSALDYVYWVGAGLLGAAFGSLLTFDTTGLDFALTALFAVIFLDQWRAQKHHLPALIGVGCSLGCLLLFGADNFIIPAMCAIVAMLFLLRKPIEKGESDT